MNPSPVFQFGCSWDTLLPMANFQNRPTMLSAALVRLAFLQFLVVMCLVVVSGLLLKSRFGSGSHFPILATYVRDYGMALLLVPTIWGVWGIFQSHRPLAGAGDVDIVVASGIALLVLLVLFCIPVWLSATTYHSLIIQVPPEHAQRTTNP